MKSYVNFIAKFRKPLLAILVIINILAIIGVTKIRINSDFDIFELDNSTKKDDFDRMNENFPTSEDMMILLQFEDDGISKDNLNAIIDFYDFLENESSIDSIISPVPFSIKTKMGMIDIRDVDDSNINILNKHYENLDDLAPVKTVEGKTYASFSVYPEENIDFKDTNRIERYLAEKGIEYYLSGNSYLQLKIIDYIRMILFFIPPCALLLILLVFRSQIKSFKATFLSVLSAGLSALWTIGILGWLGKEVSIITVLGPIFTIVIGSADGLHFISHVQDLESEGHDGKDSIIKTLKSVGVPMIITTITSIAGFLSLILMDNSAIKGLATFASLGILLAGIATWYVLPIILTGKITLSNPNKIKNSNSTFLKKLWGVPSLILVVILLGVSLFFMKDMSNEFNQLMIYKEKTEVYKSFDKIMEINKGCIPIFLVIETEDNPMDTKYGEVVLKFQEELIDSLYTDKVVSGYDFYSNIYSSLNFTDKKYPQNPKELMMVSSAIDNMFETQNQFINKDENMARLMIFPKDLSNDTLEALSKLCEKFKSENKNMKITITGSQYLMHELNTNIVKSQAKTIILAFILIFILLLISLRKMLPSLIALLPIAVTTITLYGFLGMSQISLNIITATIFSITIGVGIDYSIHFTSIYIEGKKEGLNSEEATDRAYKFTSRPILANALGLAIGFSALLLSPLRIHNYVSALMWVSMIVSVLLSLSFLPTMLKKLNRISESNII